MAIREDRALLDEYGYTPEALVFLGFSRLKGIGFHSLRKIGSPKHLVKVLGRHEGNLHNGLSELGVRVPTSVLEGLPDTDLRRYVWNLGIEMARDLAASGIMLVTPDSENYPPLLNDLDEPSRPAWLFVKGNVGLLRSHMVAVVGTRKPSQDGEFLTRCVVSLLAEREVPVISGLAYGIDSIAHEAALHLNIPTVSVLGSGILNPYPAKNQGLAERIVAGGGTIVSEYMPHDPPSAESFVWRNRLQACLSHAVVATEWKRSSGTAHTIRFAQTLGRANVSIGLSRVNRPPDAGVADTDLQWPTHEEELKAVLTRQIPNSPWRAIQGSLF